MSFGADFRQFLIDQAGITALVGTRVHQNYLPEQYSGTYIWLARRNIEHLDVIDQAAGPEPFRQLFDLECISETAGEALDLAELVADLHSHRGTFGNSSTVQAIFVASQAEDYVPRGIASNLALEVSPLELEIVGYTPAP
tara:strand:- start:782 stop:1201 length:420 start_codon:yes stop_codon:yes gene_type:complete